MSIATELERLRSAKSALKTSITAKGVAVADSVTIDGYAALVDSIVVNGGTGGGVDTSNDTVTADVMLEGFTAHDKNGILITGTIATAPTVLFNGGLIFVPKGYVPEDYTVEVPIAVATLSANVVEVPAGYYPNPQTLTVAEAGNITVFDNVVTVPVGYIKTERTVTIPEAKAATVDGNVVTIYPGFVTKEQTIEVSAGGGDIDLSGVTATAEEVLEGYAFVTSSGELMEGVIPIYQISDIIPSANTVFIDPGYYAGTGREITIGTAVAPGTITPGTANIVLSQGSFLIDDVTIKGDANLIAANIAEGVTIFGISGTHAGGGSGGGSSATKYYKCMSVNPVSKTWTGVEATKSNDGSFTFGTVVSEFSYADSIVTPIVHSIYPDDCSYEVAKVLPIPTEGLVFYEPLGAAPTTTGVTVHGTAEYTTMWGIQCLHITQSGQGVSWIGGMIDDLNFSSPHTVSFAMCATDSTGYAYYRRHFDGGSQVEAYVKPRLISNTTSSFSYGSGSTAFSGNGLLNTYEWIAVTVTVDDDKNARLYVGNDQVGLRTVQDLFGSSVRSYSIGCGYGGSGNPSSPYYGYFANLRFYDRALTSDEVMRLHQSLKPVVPAAEGKFTVTGDDYVAGVYYAEPGTKGAERRWMTAWDGSSEERMGIMLFADGYWTICNFLATYPESPDGDWDTSQPPTWEPGYELYRDHSLQYDEDYNIIGTPLGMEVAAPDLAGTWKSAGDPDMGSVTVVYGEYTPPDNSITTDNYKDSYKFRAESSSGSTSVIVSNVTKTSVGFNGMPTFTNDYEQVSGTWKYGYLAGHAGWVLVNSLGHPIFISDEETTDLVGSYSGDGDFAGYNAEITDDTGE